MSWTKRTGSATLALAIRTPMRHAPTVTMRDAENAPRSAPALTALRMWTTSCKPPRPAALTAKNGLRLRKDFGEHGNPEFLSLLVNMLAVGEHPSHQEMISSVLIIFSSVNAI